MDILKEYKSFIDKEIKKQKYGLKPESLYEPIRYLMNIGGKRLRPMLTLLGYSLYKNDVKSIVPYAIAVEAFHNFTLMHDDIMDNAPLRRGNLTVHKKWNVNTAILSGDVMLVKVYDMFLKVEPEKLQRVLTAFNQCAAEVCEGQQWDMEFESLNNVTEAQYLNMIRLKTAVLLGYSLELGAMLADADEKDCKALRAFGTNIGLGFQLKDDLLDAYGKPEKFGKQIGGDIIANKKTYLLIKALEKATGKTKRELHYWLEEKKVNKSQKVVAVKAIYDQLDIQQTTKKKIDTYFTKAFKQLDAVTIPSSANTLLKQFTQALIERES